MGRVLLFAVIFVAVLTQVKPATEKEGAKSSTTEKPKGDELSSTTENPQAAKQRKEDIALANKEMDAAAKEAKIEGKKSEKEAMKEGKASEKVAKAEEKKNKEDAKKEAEKEKNKKKGITEAPTTTEATTTEDPSIAVDKDIGEIAGMLG